MAIDRVIVNALVAAYENNESALEAIQSQILAAYISRVSVNIHISSSSGDFGSATGITLADQAAQRDMLENIAAALAELDGDEPVITARAAIMDFSSRRTEL